MIKSYYTQLKNEHLEEVVFGLEDDFPYTSIYAALDQYVGRCSPWHWHPGFEFFFVIKGSVSYHLADGVYNFSKGEGGFINSDVLHMTTPSPNGLGTTSVQIMDKQIIAGHLGSRLENKYIEPIIGNTTLNIYKFTQVDQSHIYILRELRRAFECENEKKLGYEFQIRNHLSNMWLKFFEITAPLHENKLLKRSVDSIRIKTMLSYINQHFMEKLSLSDIAKSGNISERETLRCFQRCVKMTPFDYLKDRRVQEATDRLKSTDASIMMIGEYCGFSSASYFGKIFKEKMGCTPNTFRKKLNH